MRKNFMPAKPEEIAKLGPPLFSINVSFGEHFTPEKSPTNRQFIAALREQAKNHSKSFVGTMMDHFSDHIEAAANHGKISLDDPAVTSPATTYHGLVVARAARTMMEPAHIVACVPITGRL